MSRDPERRAWYHKLYQAIVRPEPPAIDERPAPDPETAALVELLARDNEDEDGDYVALTSESWDVVYAWLAKYDRGPYAGRVSNDERPGG